MCNNIRAIDETLNTNDETMSRVFRLISPNVSFFSERRETKSRGFVIFVKKMGEFNDWNCVQGGWESILKC